MITKLVWLTPICLLLTGCGDSKPGPEGPAPPAPVAVSTVTVAAQPFPSIYQVTGTVRARTTTVVAAKWMGYVREIRVQTGDRVSAGQLLVRLEARDLEVNTSRAQAALAEVRGSIPEADGAIAAAKANLDLAQATFNRMQDLWNKQSISHQEFDEASAKLKTAQASYAMAKARRAQLDTQAARVHEEVRATEVARGYAEIAAPFSGIVVAKSVDMGVLAMPGAPLLTIEREGAFRLEASVEESYLAAIRVGQAVSVTLDGIDRVLEARVSEVTPTVDTASRAYTVKIDLPALPLLRSGAFGRASFRLGSRSMLAIPAGALTERGQLQSVLVAESGVARIRLVTAGQKTNDQVEILSGLSAGERIIFPIPAGFPDGVRVEVRQ